MNLTRLLFLIFIFFLPFDGTDYLNINLGLIHITSVDFLLAILLYLVSIKTLAYKRSVPSLFRRLFVLFILTIVLSLVNFLYIPLATIAYDLKITFNLIEYLSLFFIVTMLVDDIAYLKTILIFFTASTLMFSLLTITKSLGLPVVGYVRISHAQIGPFFIGTIALFNAMMPFSLAILATLPVVVQSVITNVKWLKLVMFSVLFLAAVISFSRSLWIAVLVQTILLWYFNVHNKLNLSRKLLFFIVVIPGLLISAQFIFDSIVSISNFRASTVESRMMGYRLALDQISTNVSFFLFGMGKGAYIKKSVEMLNEGTVVHNFLLDIFVSKGITVIFTLCTILFIILKKLIEIYKLHYMTTPVLGQFALTFGLSIAGMLVEGMFAPITTSITFWTVVSLAYSFIVIAKRNEPSLMMHRSRKRIFFKVANQQ